MTEHTPKRHPQRALTPQGVKALGATGKLQRFADGNGLYLVIAPNGSRSWVLRTVIKGKRCDLGLGSTSLVSLAQARDEAAKLRRQARAGGDPLAERRAQRRNVPTFKEAAEQVHAGLKATFRNDKHAKQWLSSLGGVFSAFGAKRVDAVTSADLLAALSADWLTKPETSRRVLQRVSGVMDWCKAQGFVTTDNPARGLTKVLPKQRKIQAHHAALPYKELPAFVTSLRASDSRESIRLAFEFLILTAARTSEVVKATWAEVDTKGKVWKVPGDRMKAGREHRVPLSKRALEILGRAKELANGGPYVFPSSSPSKPLSNMVFLMLLRRMERADITAHGFRSSFRDWASERTNFARSVCEAALAHAIKDKSEAAYHRTDLFERRRELMETWAAFAISSRGSVVQLRQKSS